MVDDPEYVLKKNVPQLALGVSGSKERWSSVSPKAMCPSVGSKVMCPSVGSKAMCPSVGSKAVSVNWF